jgi:uncharacterized protein
MKKIFLLCISLFIITNSCRIYLIKKIPKPIGWINDFENDFTKQEELSLDSIVRNFERQTSIEIAIVTLDSSYVKNRNFDSLTLQIARNWNVGKKDKLNGILISFSKKLKKIRIENANGISKIISNEETKTCIDKDFIPFFRDGKDYVGMFNGINKLIELINSKLI